MKFYFQHQFKLIKFILLYIMNMLLSLHEMYTHPHALRVIDQT